MTVLRLAMIAACLIAPGCGPPAARLTFPQHPIDEDIDRRMYDVDGDGQADFALLADEAGRFNVIGYDDDGDAGIDRRYRLDDYADDRVPHLIILLDSIPYEPVVERLEQGEWGFFQPPTKVIAPFPTMSGVIFSQIMGVAPLGGANNRHYDSRVGRSRDRIWARVWGYTNPWQRELDYHAGYIDNGLAFLNPRSWYAAELAITKKTFDKAPGRETIVYIASTSGMMSKYGAAGLEEILDGLEQLCLQLFYERDGAVKISVLSDHGHNLVPPERIDLSPTLEAAGFRVTRRLEDPSDVVIDLDGLVNYAGLHTGRARDVAAALAPLEAVEVAMFVEDDRVVVLTDVGAGHVERRGDRLRFGIDQGDPLEYAELIEGLRVAGRMDADGFVSEDDWFNATLDHEWPDAPARVWNAFHGAVVSTPDVMLAIRDGWCVGDKRFERYIDMQSSHGGLNQINSATVLLTMRRGVPPALRSAEVLPALRGESGP